MRARGSERYPSGWVNRNRAWRGPKIHWKILPWSQQNAIISKQCFLDDNERSANLRLLSISLAYCIVCITATACTYHIVDCMAWHPDSSAIFQVLPRCAWTRICALLHRHTLSDAFICVTRISLYVPLWLSRLGIVEIQHAAYTRLFIPALRRLVYRVAWSARCSSWPRVLAKPKFPTAVQSRWAWCKPWI